MADVPKVGNKKLATKRKMSKQEPKTSPPKKKMRQQSAPEESLVKYLRGLTMEEIHKVLQHVANIQLPKPHYPHETIHLMATNAAYETVSEMNEERLEFAAEEIVQRVGNVYTYGHTSLPLAASIILKAHQHGADVADMFDTVSVQPEYIKVNPNVALSEDYIKTKHKQPLVVGNYKLTCRDLLTMLPGKWMNDNVSISFPSNSASVKVMKTSSL